MSSVEESRVRRAAASLRSGSWLDRSRAQVYPLVLLVAWLTTVVVVGVTSTRLSDGPGGRPIGTDFVAFWSAGHLVLDGNPAAAYDPVALRTVECSLLGSGCPFYAWLYPPPALAIVASVAWLPYLAALLVWLLATGALYLTAVSQYLASARARVAAIASPAVWLSVGHGQNSLLSTGLMGWGLSLLPRRPVVAGALLGALVYKPQLALMLPVALIAARMWRTLLTAVLTAGAIALVSLAAFGSETWEAFFDSSALARAVLEDGLVGWEKMTSAFAAARLLGAPELLAWAVQAAVSVTCAVVVWQTWRNSRVGHLPRTAVLVVAGLMATPFALDYDAVLLTIALAALAADGLRRGFGHWEITILAWGWLAPILWRPLAMFTSLPWAQVTMAALLWVGVRRARSSANRSPI